MWQALRTLDRVLRGEATAPARLRQGQVDVPLGGMTFLLVLLGAFYGFCMGWFALFNREVPEYTQTPGECGQGACLVPSHLPGHFPVALCLQRPSIPTIFI